MHYFFHTTIVTYAIEGERVNYRNSIMASVIFSDIVVVLDGSVATLLTLLSETKKSSHALFMSEK